MRLWSIHPKYLDPKGLLGLWREAILAKEVLKQKNGYYNHPQLNRFKEYKFPLKAINIYLKFIYDESIYRNYIFNINKIDLKYCNNNNYKKINVSFGQILYELDHLKKKFLLEILSF